MVSPEPDIAPVAKYLLDHETVVVCTHRHWTIVFEPVATAVAALVFIVALGISGSARLDTFLEMLCWFWFALVGRAVWKVWEWRRDYFVATDRRLLLIYGFITRRVAMMPLKKVTDLTYYRSVWGRLLGFGTFVLESAGQDQAMHEIGHIQDPDHTYRDIIGQIFRRGGGSTDEDDEDDEGATPARVAVATEDDDPTRNLALHRFSEFVAGHRSNRSRRRDQPAEDSEVGAVHRPADAATPRPHEVDDWGQLTDDGTSLYRSAEYREIDGGPGSWTDPTGHPKR